jgi:alpha-L-fucosidase
VPDDPYKSSHALIQMLVDVVAKGGNLLLNIGPGPDGAWHDAAYARLAALGVWTKVNGEAIYGTRPIAPNVSGQLRFTAAKDGTTYAIYLPKDGERTYPRDLTMPDFVPNPNAKMFIVGTNSPIQWERSGSGIVAHIPTSLMPQNGDAWVFRFKPAKP